MKIIYASVQEIYCSQWYVSYTGLINTRAYENEKWEPNSVIFRVEAKLRQKNPITAKL